MRLPVVKTPVQSRQESSAGGEKADAGPKHRILVVDAPEAVQLDRLVRRDGIDEALARRMIERQASRTERLGLAHDVIENSGYEAALEQAVRQLHELYLALSRSRS